MTVDSAAKKGRKQRWFAGIVMGLSVSPYVANCVDRLPTGPFPHPINHIGPLVDLSGPSWTSGYDHSRSKTACGHRVNAHWRFVPSRRKATRGSRPRRRRAAGISVRARRNSWCIGRWVIGFTARNVRSARQRSGAGPQRCISRRRPRRFGLTPSRAPARPFGNRIRVDFAAVQCRHQFGKKANGRELALREGRPQDSRKRPPVHAN